jgi:hypothetical protein
VALEARKSAGGIGLFAGRSVNARGCTFAGGVKSLLSSFQWARYGLLAPSRLPFPFSILTRLVLAASSVWYSRLEAIFARVSGDARR